MTGLAREAGATPAQVFGGLFVVVLALAWRALQSRIEDTAQQVTPPAPPGRLPAAVFWGGGGAIIFAGFMSENAVEGWSALHIERTLHGGAAEGGALGPAVLGLTMGFGRFGGQLVAARGRPATVVVLAALLSAAGSVTAAMAPPTPWVAYLGGFGVLGGLGVSVIAPMAFAMVGARVADEMRARAISRAAVVGYFASSSARQWWGGSLPRRPACAFPSCSSPRCWRRFLC